MPTASDYSALPPVVANLLAPTPAQVGGTEQEVQPHLTESSLLLTGIEAAIKDGIQASLNECHGTLGVCHAAVLGSIERDLARAGLIISAVDSRVLRDAGGTMRELWAAAFGASIPPPTETQLAAALAGQPIPEPSADGEPAANLTAATAPDAQAVAALVTDITAAANPTINTCPAPFLADVLPDGSELWVFTQPIYDSAGNYVRCDTRSSVLPVGTQVTGGPTPDQNPYPPVATPNGGGGGPVPSPDGGPPQPQPPPPPPPPPVNCPPGYFALPDGTCVNQFGFPPPPPGVIPTTPPPPPPPTLPPPNCPPGTVALGDGTCSGPNPFPPPGQPPPPPPSPPSQCETPPGAVPNGPGYYVAYSKSGCGSTGFPMQTSCVDLINSIPIALRAGVTFAGPFAVTQEGNDWAAARQPASCGQPTVPGGGGGPPPPPPPPPPPGNCPTCQAGYHWAQDSAGNPICIKDCSCPVCPSLPGGNGGGPPPPPEAPKPPEQPPGGGLCGPSSSGDFEAFVNIIAGVALPGSDFKCGPGLSSWLRDQIVGGINPFGGSGSTSFIQAAFNSLQCAASWMIDNAFKPFFPTGDCNLQASVAWAYTSFIPKVIDKVLGVLPGPLKGAMQQHENYICQWMVPSVPELNAAWSRNWLTDDEWKFGVKLNGHCVPWQEKSRELSRVRIGITDAYRLWKLEKISDDDFERAWKEQAIDWERDRATWGDAIQQYPPMADLVRMMVRDIGDQTVVNDFDLDAEFDQKWTDFLQKWGVAQGVSDDIAKAYWRAHWQAPSPSQIFEWLHRLRPDDRDPNDPFSSVVVDRDKAKRFLQIADYVPGLIDAYLATSYRPFTRVDIRRMYRTGVFKTEAEVRRAYRDLGSDADHAQKLTDFTIKSEGPARAKLQGQIGELDVTKALIAGTIDDREARDLYDAAGVDADDVDARIQAAHRRADISDRKRILDALKRRFFMGEFSANEIQGELAAQGMPIDRVPQISRVWTAEREAKAKQPAVGMLCKWWSRNLITLDDFFQRVRNLNYKEADALLVVQNCQVGLQELRQKELERETRRVEQQAKQAARERAAAAKAARPYTVVKPRVSLGSQFKRVQTVTTTNGKATAKVTDTVTDQQTLPPTPPPIVP